MLACMCLHVYVLRYPSLLRAVIYMQVMIYLSSYPNITICLDAMPPFANPVSTYRWLRASACASASNVRACTRLRSSTAIRGESVCVYVDDLRQIEAAGQLMLHTRLRFV